jgi:hypothetical protein
MVAMEAIAEGVHGMVRHHHKKLALSLHFATS